MCSGQLFSQGESARSSQTPARQRWARMWSSNSCRKWRMVVSTGLGAVWPRPHREVSRIMRPSSSSRSRSSFGALAVGELVQDAQGLVQADAAGDAFAAGFGVGELDEVAGDVHHAVVFVHHHHAAGAHDGAELRQRFVIHRRVEHLLRDAAAGRAAGLHGLDVAGRRTPPSPTS